MEQDNKNETNDGDSQPENEQPGSHSCTTYG